MKPIDACHFLNNKAYFFPPPVHDDGEDERPHSTPFTCIKTHEPIGPDGESVSDECCGPDRPCYRPELRI